MGGKGTHAYDEGYSHGHEDGFEEGYEAAKEEALVESEKAKPAKRAPKQRRRKS